MRLTIFLYLVALVACAGPPVERPVANPLPSATDDTCGASRYAGVLGKDAFVLQRGFRPGEIRIIYPGTVASQEFLPERLGFIIGNGNTIRQIICG